MTLSTSPEPADVLLGDGSIATIRPATAADTDALLDLHENVSDDSLRLRFFSTGRTSGPAYVAHLVSEDADALALVAVQHGRVIGLATAEPVGATAEISFLVADAAHGLGVGTLLLEHLAAWSRTAGVVRFTAEVLTENHQMLQVFTDAGFCATRRLRSGVVSWELTTSATESAQAAADARERHAERSSLNPLLRPRSVAVVGVSRTRDGIGRAVLASITTHGFTGSLFVVHPTATEIDGVRAYPSLTVVPEHVDVVVVTAPAEAVVAAVRDAAAAGSSSVVVISAGLETLGDIGAQREILAVAREHNIRILGPNCLGLLCNDPTISLNATFSPVAPLPGGLAIASQSGGVGIALLDQACERGLGIQSFVSLGNQPDVSGNDLLAAWRDDPDVTAAGFYLEGFGGASKFARLARRFSERKPLLAVLAGTTGSGARTSRTPVVPADALFAQTGVLSCRDTDDLIGAAHLLTTQPLPRGRRIGIISNAGGIGRLTADAADRCDLRVADLAPDAAPGLRNPLDLGPAARPEDLLGTAREVLRSDEVDMLVIAIVGTSVSDPEPLLLAAAELSRESTTIPVAVVAMGGLRPAPLDGVALFRSPEDATRALRHAVTYAEWRSLPRDTWTELDEDRAIAARSTAVELLDGDGSRWLDTTEQDSLLGAYGIHPLGEVAPDALEAGRAARRIGYPVAVKVAGTEVVRKTDRKLVRVGLRDTAAVLEAVRGFQAELQRSDVPVLVQPVAQGPELALGAHRHPTFGPVVTVAAGGTTSDLLADRAFLVPPLTRRDAARALRSLRLWPVLDGYRGAPLADTDALEALVVEIGNLVRDVPEVAELDLNPVMATPTGVVVVDIKVRLAASYEMSDITPRQLSRPQRNPRSRPVVDPERARSDSRPRTNGT